MAPSTSAPEAASPSGPLQTQHVYASSNGRVSLVVHTLPQRHLTLMGGSRERVPTRGVVHVEGDAKSVKLKVIAKVTTRAPRNGLNPTLEGVPSSIAHALQELELLTLTSELSGALPSGSNAVPFSLDLPRTTADGKDLPSSYVLVGRSKSRKAREEEWASVRYELRLVIERGLLRKKEVVVAPFAFIAPPPLGPSVGEAMERAARVDAALKRGAVAGDFRETTSWARSPLPAPKAAEVAAEAPGLFARMFGARHQSVLKEETWEVRLAPWPYPLRSAGVPFAVQCTRRWSGAAGSKALEQPTMRFLQTAELPGAAANVRPLVTFGLVDKPLRILEKVQAGAETESFSWLGLMPIPPATTPSFVTLPLRVSHTIEVVSPFGAPLMLPLIVVAHPPVAVRANAAPNVAALNKAQGLPIHPHPSTIYAPTPGGGEVQPTQTAPYVARLPRPVASAPNAANRLSSSVTAPALAAQTRPAPSPPVHAPTPPPPPHAAAPVPPHHRLSHPAAAPTAPYPASTPHTSGVVNRPPVPPFGYAHVQPTPAAAKRASYHAASSAAFPTSTPHGSHAHSAGRATRQSLVASSAAASHAAAVEAAVRGENEKTAMRRRCASQNALASTLTPAAAAASAGSSRPVPLAPSSATATSANANANAEAQRRGASEVSGASTLAPALPGAWNSPLPSPALQPDLTTSAAAAAQAPPLPAKTSSLPTPPAPSTSTSNGAGGGGAAAAHAAAVAAHASAHPGLARAIQHHFGPSTVAGGAISHTTTYTSTVAPPPPSTAASPLAAQAQAAGAVGASHAATAAAVSAAVPGTYAHLTPGWEFADETDEFAEGHDDALPPSYFEVTGLPAEEED